MIQRLNSPFLSFKGEGMSPREAYDSQMTKISQTAQKQNGMVVNLASAQTNNQIPMQGAGQKLDVIA